MDRTRVEETLRDMLRDITANPDFLTSDVDQDLEMLGLDSIGMIDLVYALERVFSLTIADEDVLPEHFQSIKTLGRFIAQKASTATIKS